MENIKTLRKIVKQLENTKFDNSTSEYLVWCSVTNLKTVIIKNIIQENMKK